MSSKSVSVVYPVFNEELLVESTIRKSIEALEEQRLEFEIIVVDDFSSDKTPLILKRLQAEFSFLKVIRNTVNLGQGMSILAGFGAASKDFVIHNGIDYPFDLRHLSKLLKHTVDHDLVVAARSSYAGYPLSRMFISWVNRALVRSLFGLKLQDTNFVQLYRRTLVMELPVSSKSTGFITTEMILLAQSSGIRIAQEIVPYEPRELGKPKNSKWTIVLSSFLDLMRFYANRLKSEKIGESKAKELARASEREVQKSLISSLNTDRVGTD